MEFVVEKQAFFWYLLVDHFKWAFLEGEWL